MFLLLHLQLRMAVFAIFGLPICFLFVGVASAAVSEKCEPETSFAERNRDGVKPSFPLEENPRLETSNILKAHEILRNGLHQFLNKFVEDDLGFYLNKIVDEKPTFRDEYDQEIPSYFKVFESIWQQYNETLCRNYATDQFENDKLDLYSVARFLSHQTTVEDNETIMKRMGDALEYRCHPCTPYKRRQFGQNSAQNTDYISPEGMSLEERFVLCKDYDQDDKFIGLSSTEPNSTFPISTLSTTAKQYQPSEPVYEDFYSCRRRMNYLARTVTCDQISLEEVRRAFNQTSVSLEFSVILILKPYIVRETFIPEDVFGTTKIKTFVIQYPDDVFINRSLSLQVDADAFRSTKAYTTDIRIMNIDCTLLDLDFLTGFDQLTHLYFWNVHNIQRCFPSLPPLPRLISLDIADITGMNHLNIFPTLTNGLMDFSFRGRADKIDTISNDETAERIIDWLLLSSANNLEEMSIRYMNQVTRVPDKIATFKALRKLSLHNNNIKTIKSGALSFSTTEHKIMELNGNGIREIEPGAFQGDFKHASVNLENNNLTRFEESVFGSMLQQMASGKGWIRAGENPIDCSDGSICHLAWLRRHLRFSLDCSNGTSFKDLQPAGFRHCP